MHTAQRETLMPSPIAHASLALLARPWLQRHEAEKLPRYRRWLFYGLTVFALCAADLDFALLLLPEHPLHGHGTFTHSLLAATIFAPLWATVAWHVLQKIVAWRWLYAVGLLAYGSHLLMDMLTRGRGIMLLWPFSDQRYASPLPLFVGAEHSNPTAWRWHLLTLSTELAFAGLVWLVARRLERFTLFRACYLAQ